MEFEEKIKRVGIALEAENEKAILTAQAEKQKRVLEAEGQRDADLAKASGILAKGKAEAEARMLKTQALYAGEAGARRAEVRIQHDRAAQLRGILKDAKIVPQDVLLNLGANLAGMVYDRRGAEKN